MSMVRPLTLDILAKNTVSLPYLPPPLLAQRRQPFLTAFRIVLFWRNRFLWSFSPPFVVVCFRLFGLLPSRAFPFSFRSSPSRLPTLFSSLVTLFLIVCRLPTWFASPLSSSLLLFLYSTADSICRSHRIESDAPAMKSIRKSKGLKEAEKGKGKAGEQSVRSGAGA